MNYQATYNRPGNTHHLAKVTMRRNESLRDYSNRFFENRNQLAGVKDEDVIQYYKKGVTNLKLFKKIHEAGATTIANLMAYVEKLVDTQDAIVHDFKGDKTDDGSVAPVADKSRKRTGEVLAADASGGSTFLEEEFTCTLNDIC